MSEPQTTRRWRPRRLPRACDTCYNRKVRCDRGDPCSNCRAAAAPCLRLRPKQSGSDRPNIEPHLVNGLVARINHLEQSIHQSSVSPVREEGAEAQQAANARGLKRQIHGSSNHVSPTLHEEPDQPPGQRPRTSPPEVEALDAAPGTPQSEPEREMHNLNQEDVAISHLDMQRYLRPRLYSDEPIGSMLREILDSALFLAKNFTASENTPGDFTEDPSTILRKQAANVCPPMDLLYFMIKVAYRSPTTASFFDIHNCSSPDQLQDMAKQLISGTVDGESKYHYMICVNYFVYLSLKTTTSEQNGGDTAAYMEASAKRYLDITTASLRVMDMRVKPDPMLLQALLTGAMLMQQIGNVRRCWELKSVACGVCDALNRRWEASSPGRQDCRLQTQLNFLKCRVFNVSLTAINNQPSSPLDFEADSTLLKPDIPSHAILLILVEFAKVQEAFVREIRLPPTPGNHRQLRTDEIRDLKPKMMQIKRKMEQLRKGVSPVSDDFLTVNWMVLEHIFHSMMTSITKLSGAQDDSEAYLECILHARRALSSLKLIIDRVLSLSLDASKSTMALSWILPLYSLRPLYVIFNNVITKSDTLDLKLIQDVAIALRTLASRERFAMGVSHLFDSFVGLYDQFANRLIYADEDFYSQTTEAQKAIRLSADVAGSSQIRLGGSQATHDENSDVVAEAGAFDQLTLRANNLDLPVFDPELFDQDVALELSFIDPILNPLELDSFASGFFS